MYRGAVDLAIDIPSQRGCRVCAMTHDRQPGRGKRPWWNWSILSTDLQMTTERDVLIVRRVGMRDGAAALACAGPRLAERPRRWPGGFVRRAAASPAPPARQVRTLTHAPGSRASTRPSLRAGSPRPRPRPHVKPRMDSRMLATTRTTLSIAAHGRRRQQHATIRGRR